jgi:hypothetical protein
VYYRGYSGVISGLFRPFYEQEHGFFSVRGNCIDLPERMVLKSNGRICLMISVEQEMMENNVFPLSKLSDAFS